MFCPDCRAEYRSGFDRCSTCHVPLIPRLPGNKHEADLVQILETTDSAFLPMACSVLEAAGIPHVVQGDEALKLFPLGMAARGVTSRVLGARLLVPREHAEEARALLETPAEPSPEIQDESL
jgi:hypothetical protein